MKKFVYTKGSQSVTVETDGLGEINNFMITGLIGKDFGDIVSSGFNLKTGDRVTIAEMINTAKTCKCKVSCYESNRLIENESADFTSGEQPISSIISGLTLGVAYNESTYNAIVPSSYVSEHPYSESEPSMPWLVSKFQIVSTTPTVEEDEEEPVEEEAKTFDVRMWADDYQLSFGGTSSNVGTVSDDKKVLTVSTPKSYLMFEIIKDLGVSIPKNVTWFRMRIDFEGRTYSAETYVTPQSI